MAFGNNREQKLFSEINITPLTDIFLVLLIIMMVVAPSFQSNEATVNMPEINNGVNIEEGRVTVSVAGDGTIYVNGDPIGANQLTDKLIALKNSDDEKKEVIVKADKNVKSAKIMDIMDSAQNAEYKKLIVAGEPLNKKEQNELKKNSHSAVDLPLED